MSATARNVLIILAAAAAVALLPGGGTAGATALQALYALMLVAVGWFAVRLYRERRVDLETLPDRIRAILYTSLGLIVLTATASGRLWQTGAGTLVWFALVALICAGLLTCWRAWRAY
ncbi:MAG: hypothetical protein U0T02_02880 [Solirubrobacteraceae bacterium]